MFRNYFLTAWRNLLRNRSYSVVNILGLAIGMAVALVIGLWVVYQYSYDRQLPGYQRVAQVHTRSVRNGEATQNNGTVQPLAEALRKEVPGIRYVAHTDWMGTHGLTAGEHKVYLAGAEAEEDFFRIFPYPVLRGDANKALHDPYSIVLTESTGRALFGGEDPMGKKVRVDNQQDFVVGAVIRDLPRNSSFGFNYVLPFAFDIAVNDWVKRAQTNWSNYSFQTYVALDPGASVPDVEARMSAVVKKYNPEAWKSSREELFLHRMSDWHLYSGFKNGRPDGGFIDYVRLFSIIGVLVLLIACVNFMNLSTARSEKRAREVGVRKVVGSLRRDLIVQFLVESMVITLLAAVIAVGLVEAALPAFDALTGCDVGIPWGAGVFWAVMAGYVVGTALLAGARPAFYLSSFRPVRVLKGVNVGRGASWPRKVLVILQFTCSVALIISTLLIYRQIQYAKDRPTGYDANRLVYTDGSDDLGRNYEGLRDELLRTGLVDKVTRASTFVSDIWNWSSIQDWSGRYPNEQLAMATVDVVENYFSTVGMRFVMGKNFSGNLAADTLCVVLNEAAVKRMRFKDPLGQVIMFRKGHRIKVIGVVKDAVMLSPFSPAEPTFFTYSPGDAGNILYRLSPFVEVHTAMARLAPIFNKYNPTYPFIYHFADQTYGEKFQFEELIGKLAGIFAALAIFISCLGLFGLAAYMAEQRMREIGIRKVLGASMGQLWYLLSKDFVMLVLVSCVVASPVAWYFLHGWLQRYSYRISIGAGVFLEAGAIALLITVVTVGGQAMRGALTNPTKSLRSE